MNRGTAERTSVSSRSGPDFGCHPLSAGRLAIGVSLLLAAAQVPHLDMLPSGQFGGVLVDLQQAVGRGEPAEVVRRGRTVVVTVPISSRMPGE